MDWNEEQLERLRYQQDEYIHGLSKIRERCPYCERPMTNLNTVLFKTEIICEDCFEQLFKESEENEDVQDR